MELIKLKYLLKPVTFRPFQNASPEVVKVLTGNKCECSQAQRSVDKERGEKVIFYVILMFTHNVTCLSNRVREGREKEAINQDGFVDN